MRVTSEITGLKEVIKNCEKIMGDIEQVLGPATKAGADVIRDDAKSRIHNISGTLAKGIISEVTWDKKKSKAFAGVGMDRGMNDIFVVHSKTGTRYYIPAAVEYGHRTPGGAMNIQTTKRGKRKKSKKKIKAKPFMRPALKANRANVVKIIDQHVSSAISKGGV